MKTKGNLNLISLLLVCVMLTACSRVGEQATSTPVPPSALPSDVPTLPYTATPTIRPTATRVPALPRPLAEAELIKLLHNNGGCRLPCFWGFEPGETQKDTFSSFLYSFHSLGSFHLKLPKNGSIIEVFLYSNAVSNEDDSETIDWLHVDMQAYRYMEYAGETYVRSEYDNLSFPDYIRYYTLPELLSTYGKPHRVWMGIDMGSLDTRGGEDVVLLYVEYPEAGWAVNYRMPLRQDGENYFGCPAQAFTTLSLWTPGDNQTALEIASWLQGFLFEPVEEVTSLSVEEFYQRFKAPNYDKCLETPRDVWPWE